jgi:hypothetical protein
VLNISAIKEKIYLSIVFFNFVLNTKEKKRKLIIHQVFLETYLVGNKGDIKMVWQLILEIIFRILAGLLAVGFWLGLFLYDKHPIWKRVFVNIGLFTTFYGFGRLLIYAIAGL